MTQRLIRTAFETRLSTWAAAQSPVLPVAWENRAFSPPNGSYIRAMLLPARTNNLFLDTTGRSYTGIFQVSLYMLNSGGPQAAELLAQSLDEHFTGSFTQGSIRVVLLSPMSAAPAFQAVNRYVVPVSAEYRVVSS